MIITFPNIRANFIPDPGYTLFDVDLEGADAQVVAWDAGDEDLKAAFRARLKVHAKNAKDIYGEALAGLDGKREPLYTRTKRAVHATHYGATPRALATKCKMTLPEARHFQTRWLDELHPAIRDWMHGIDFSLQTTGGVKNAFGYGVNFYQRGSDAFTEALAWRPQSTVARVCEIAMVRLYKHVPECQILLQAHDSINFQIKTEAVPYILPKIYRLLHSIIVPYPDPLIIPWEIKASTSSWGECKQMEWGTYVDVANITAAIRAQM